MASQASLSRGGKDADHLKDMAGKLLVKLSANGAGEKGGRKACDQLHEKLAELATYVADPSITVDALLGLLKGAREPSSLRLGHPEAEALLGQIMASLEEETTSALDSGRAIPRLRELLLLVAQKLDMVPLRDSDPVHMVDGNSNFCEASVADMVKCSPQLSTPNAPYAVVSIVGAQSSGKSYLLNRLFGTKFPEMDAKRGRSQTTRGIMMSRCIGPSLLVLDIEGFDGREKGQDTLFEKQVALLALTISDIMLVNMNVFDIGREQAGGTLLFKTIFKERVKLDPGLTKILVVLRMYDGETPLEALKYDVMTSLEKVWKSVNVESRKFEDYIEVNVVGLPDKNSQDFLKEVTALRRLLSNTNLDHGRSAKVPASSFPVSSGIFWDKIKKNKKLDIPSHQVALARLFCRQTVDDALNSIDSWEDYKRLKGEEYPGRFKEVSDTLLERAIIMYNQETKMYDPKERDDGCQYMIEKLNKVIIDVSRELILKTRIYTSKQFKGQYDKNLKNMEENDADINDDGQIVDSCVTEFMNSFKDLKVFDSEYLRRTCEELQKDLHSYTLYHIFTIKEIRCMKEIKQAEQKLKELEEQKELAQQNLNKALKTHEETTKERQDAEAEMERQKENLHEEKMDLLLKNIARKQEHITTGTDKWKSMTLLDVNEDEEDSQSFPHESEEDKQEKIPLHAEEVVAELATPVTRDKHMKATPARKNSRWLGRDISEGNAPDSVDQEEGALYAKEDQVEVLYEEPDLHGGGVDYGVVYGAREESG